MSDQVALLERALDQTESVIAAIRPAPADLPTPCPGWTVRDLVDHLVGRGLRNGAAAARGETIDWLAPADPLGDDWLGQFRAGAGPLRDAWRSADLDATVGQMTMRDRASQQIAELAVHGWDLVTATGVSVPLDDKLAEHALVWSHGMLRPEHRGPDKAFADEVPVPSDAPAYERLAGWFGRDPSWRPA